ncbi:MAG: GntP family gluconate:H+ symporter [Clostridium sp.]|jgi:GntP family gluconate:H+ symporter
MVTGPILLVIFVISIGILLLSIIKFKINPFISLLITSIITAFLVRMPVSEISTGLTKGFGNTLSGIGIVIGLGIIFGKLLSEAFATDQVANTLLNKVGEKNAPLAVNIAGYLVSIPVYLDAAFVIFMPLVKKLAAKTKRPVIVLVTALSVGAITAHALVIPTPGPLAVAGNMGVNIGVFLLYAIIVSLPATLVGGWLYSSILSKKKSQTIEEVSVAEEEVVASTEIAGDRPSGALSIIVLLFPIILILSANIMGVILPKGSSGSIFFNFIGDKNIALLLAILLAIVTLKKYIKRNIGDAIIEAADSAGLILLITGAGGAFGNIINTSGIGNYLVQTMMQWNISIIILGFILSQILRAAQGSTTVALVTTSSILGPIAASMGASPVLVGLAICAGGVGLSLPNDSGFWVISRFGGLSVTDTLKSWTIGGTLSGVTALLMVLLLNTMSGFLPGL